MDAAGRPVAEEAAMAVLELPEAHRNGALPSLVSYLAFEAPTVDPLPLMFLREGAHDPDLLERARHFAVGGRLLVARIRWLDEMIDSVRLMCTPEEIHRLSTAVYREALSCFSSGLGEGREAASFFELLVGLEARYSASLAVDASASGVLPRRRGSIRVKLGPYSAFHSN